jgi:hypothetical protein
MHSAVMNELSDATIFIGAAAVADYRPRNVADYKIKKTDQDFSDFGTRKNAGYFVGRFRTTGTKIFSSSVSRLKRTMSPVTRNRKVETKEISIWLSPTTSLKQALGF